MSFLINKDKFFDIENGFTRLKSNDSDVAALRNIGDALSSLTQRTIVVNTIRPENKSQSCFIMCVYPDESVLDAIINAIVMEDKDSVIEKIWNDSTKWNIEIDTRILTPMANFTEKELTALILHEVGHIIYSNSVPMKISKIIKYEFATSKIVNKELLKDTFFSKLLYIPLLNLCQSTKNKDSLRIELKADKYSANSGVYYVQYPDVGQRVFIPFYHLKDDSISAYVIIDNTSGTSKYYISMSDGTYGYPETLYENFTKDNIVKYKEIKFKDASEVNYCEIKKATASVGGYK